MIQVLGYITNIQMSFKNHDTLSVWWNSLFYSIIELKVQVY